MQLTPENKAEIDAKSLEQLMERIRSQIVWGDPWLEGETGIYWWNRIKALRAEQRRDGHQG